MTTFTTYDHTTDCRHLDTRTTGNHIHLIFVAIVALFLLPLL